MRKESRSANHHYIVIYNSVYGLHEFRGALSVGTKATSTFGLFQLIKLILKISASVKEAAIAPLRA